MTGRHDQDLGAARALGEISRARMADRDRRVGLQQEQRHRPADDCTSPDYDRATALKLDAIVAEQRHSTQWRGRNECVGIAER